MSKFRSTSKMPSDNSIILASAGSGKTTTLVEEAGKNDQGRSALITYTLNGRSELANKAYQIHGAIPPHLTINTWYTFVLTHFVRPYQNHIHEPRIKTIIFDRMPDVLRRIPKTNAKFYFTKKQGVWKDRVTDFACRIIEKTNGLPIKRIEDIFTSIYIDEAQDLSGWDLELIEYLLKSKVKVSLIGDHRQATFTTNDNPKNKQFAGKKIIGKFEAWEKAGLAKITHHAHSHRCNQAICDFADLIFPDCKKTTSHNTEETGHDGLFFVRQSDIPAYMKSFAPQPLRYNKTRKIEYGEPLNFGDSKGMTFERTLIYPHSPFEKYVGSGNLEDAGKELSKIYVAITRAQHSVGFVVPDKFKSNRLPYFNS
ncbi:UvrD-helicase domain-containing protein [Agrobacterium sp. LAD9]|uniref:UvrD-helicase domain-containing protein n=1 Tax=Agrobacterium sp. LAD9 TaxID=2055153 RepID=UPI000D1FD2AE|nr:UvrD-helicase domain-containing protein [Agrobacterium sp. LAD9]